jgi:CheY-like chemotaxis protein
MDGLEATKQIRRSESGDAFGRRTRRLPVIAMTARAMEGNREKVLEAGMDDYIAKPVMPRPLADLLDKWLVKAPPDAGLEESASEIERQGVTTQPSSSIFDWTALLGRLMGNKPLATKVLAGFLNDMPRQIQALAKFTQTGSAEEVENQAHRIKGAAATVSGEALRAAALEIEMAGKRGDLDLARDSIAKVNSEFLRLELAIIKQREG